MDNLLCLRKRNFILTTDSHHGLPIYPNLAKNMVLTGINQLWIADITYIRLEVEFVYLAVLLDAFSRSCIGWALRRSLEAGLVLEALRMALRQRRPQPGLVHHSDRGVQYAAGDYIALLKKHGINLSMSRLEKAMLWELIPLERNPMGLVELKGVSKRKKSPRILTVEEVGALLKELVHPYRCMVLLAGCIGLRISEVLGLRWTGIKFETLCMEIREGFARSQVTKLKSEYSQDEMPLDPDVAAILLEWKQLCPQTKGDWVFPSPRTEKPYDSGSLRKKVLKTAALRAKISGAIGWHTLRHSYRAWLDETGAPLGVQQKLMRHANISTTMNIYGGAFMKAKRKANTSVVQRLLLQDHTK